MTSSTTRHSSPAASRTGRVAAALPQDPGLDAILADPDIGPTAKLIVIALVKHWAWVRDHAWPSDRTIAAKIGKSPGHVQRGLRELEQAGHIDREKTADVPNGRRIWLLWRCTGGCAGARAATAPALTIPAAPARSEQVVLVTQEVEPEIPPAPPRPRPEAALTAMPFAKASTTVTAALPVADRSLPPVLSPRPLESAREPCRTLPAPGREPPLVPTFPAAPWAARGLPGDGTAPSAPAHVVEPTVLDHGAHGRSANPAAWAATVRLPRVDAPVAPIPPASSRAGNAPRRQKQGLSLTLDELVKVVGETADPILAAEVARRTAPPTPPGPAPGALSMVELLERLPGRHDLILAVARRLTAETGDFKAASLRAFEMMAGAVAGRRVPAAVLIDCWRQGTGPRARHKGKVLVAAWKRSLQVRRE